MNDCVDAGLVELQTRNDARGSLVVIEAQREVPFEIRRLYYVFGSAPGVSRGHHAHRKLQQFAIAVAGAVTMLMDDGRRRWQVQLTKPDKGLLIPPLIWHEMHSFSSDCVLLVLANDLYDERDYIRDHAEFKRLCS